jgi:hypothetical protein
VEGQTKKVEAKESWKGDEEDWRSEMVEFSRGREEKGKKSLSRETQEGWGGLATN